MDSMQSYFHTLKLNKLRTIESKIGCHKPCMCFKLFDVDVNEICAEQSFIRYNWIHRKSSPNSVLNFWQCSSTKSSKYTDVGILKIYFKHQNQFSSMYFEYSIEEHHQKLSIESKFLQVQLLYLPFDIVSQVCVQITLILIN